MHYVHTLTDLEVACGVTLDDVARELPRGVFREHDGVTVFYVDWNLSPALASSVARAAFAGARTEYRGRGAFGRGYEVVSD